MATGKGSKALFGGDDLPSMDDLKPQPKITEKKIETESQTVAEVGQGRESAEQTTDEVEQTDEGAGQGGPPKRASGRKKKKTDTENTEKAETRPRGRPRLGTDVLDEKVGAAVDPGTYKRLDDLISNPHCEYKSISDLVRHALDLVVAEQEDWVAEAAKHKKRHLAKKNQNTQK